MIDRLREHGIEHEAVLEAMLQVPRHLFVDEALSSRAYDDVALPINYRQTISRPYTVARSLSLLYADGLLNNVLEIGTGCGYQAAVLAQLSPHVSSVERILMLHRRARLNLQRLGLDHVMLRHDDGSNGLPAWAPYDGIVLAAATDHIPGVLCDQLTSGGRMVLPVGDEEHQALYLIQRRGTGFQEHFIEPARFVPLLNGKVTD